MGAIDELCIGDLTPSHAAERMIDLADGSTLGEALFVMEALLTLEPQGTHWKTGLEICLGVSLLAFI